MSQAIALYDKIFIRRNGATHPSKWLHSCCLRVGIRLSIPSSKFNTSSVFKMRQIGVFKRTISYFGAVGDEENGSILGRRVLRAPDSDSILN